MTAPSDPDEADALLHDLEPFMRSGLGGPAVPPDLAERIERFAAATGVDPDNVPALHAHRNPVTGQVATAGWPCPQCIALGRTESLKHGRDFPDEGGAGPATLIPPDRLEAYLATFPTPPQPGGHRARRKARRKAEHQERRKNR
jgi:hypothetical protein